MPLQSVLEHCREIDRCNQRGGRMLSIVDLLDANTLDLNVAAFLVNRISRGESFMVGALPGGAGKTTVMGALLNFVPADVSLVAATAEAVTQADDPATDGRHCYICHEISSAPYFAYLWSATARRYFQLGQVGHMLATNLHADTFDQCRDQLCIDNDIPEAHFRGVGILLFLDVSGGWSRTRRRVDTAYAADGDGPHRLVFRHQRGGWRATEYLLVSERHERCRDFLEDLRRAGKRCIADVREAVLSNLLNDQ